MPEQFLIKTEGGPNPGISIIDETQYEWPLPGILGGIGGSYVKVAEEYISVRTACYRWFTDGQLQEAKNATAED